MPTKSDINHVLSEGYRCLREEKWTEGWYTVFKLDDRWYALVNGDKHPRVFDKASPSGAALSDLKKRKFVSAIRGKDGVQGLLEKRGVDIEIHDYELGKMPQFDGKEIYIRKVVIGNSAKK